MVSFLQIHLSLTLIWWQTNVSYQTVFIFHIHRTNKHFDKYLRHIISVFSLFCLSFLDNITWTQQWKIKVSQAKIYSNLISNLLQIIAFKRCQLYIEDKLLFLPNLLYILRKFIFITFLFSIQFFQEEHVIMYFYHFLRKT